MPQGPSSSQDYDDLGVGLGDWNTDRERDEMAISQTTVRN